MVANINPSHGKTEHCSCQPFRASGTGGGEKYDTSDHHGLFRTPLNDELLGTDGGLEILSDVLSWQSPPPAAHSTSSCSGTSSPYGKRLQYKCTSISPPVPDPARVKLVSGRHIVPPRPTICEEAGINCQRFPVTLPRGIFPLPHDHVEHFKLGKQTHTARVPTSTLLAVAVLTLKEKKLHPAILAHEGSSVVDICKTKLGILEGTFIFPPLKDGQLTTSPPISHVALSDSVFH